MRVNLFTKNLVFLILFFAGCLTISANAQNRQLTFDDIMKFEEIGDPVISDSAGWVAYSVWPDRGDGRVVIKSVDSTQYYEITRGEDPKITPYGVWVGVRIKPPLKERLNVKNGKEPKPGVSFLHTRSGRIISYDSVRSFTFSNDGQWAALQKFGTDSTENKKPENDYLGTELKLLSLMGDTAYSIPNVSEFAFDSTSAYLAYSVVDTSGEENGLYYRNLSSPQQGNTIKQLTDGYFNNLTWNDKHKKLGFTASTLDDSNKPGPATLSVWSAKEGLQQLVDDSAARDGWTLRSTNELKWTTDGKRLFFGFLPEEMVEVMDNGETDSTGVNSVYSMEAILKNTAVDVWHWDDPRIKPHEKETWKERKKELYQAVYHFESDEWIQLADHRMPEVEFTNSPKYTLGSSDIPYLKEMTWNGFFDDYYVVDLQTGERKRVARKLRFGAQISPGGRYIVFFEDRQWHLYDVGKEICHNLTEQLDNPFFNEDHDYPYPEPGYGIAGWLKGDRALLIYDKYDVWQFPTDGTKPMLLTGGVGREEERVFRIQDLTPDSPYFKPGEQVLLESYHDKKKNDGFYTAQIDSSGVVQRFEEAKRFNVITKARKSPRILYTSESYTEYPNLWISSGIEFTETERISALNLDVTKKYDWGTAELVEWNSLDGDPMQGVLIKPGNYQEGQRYPLLIYYYRSFSDRLHEFNVPRNNHRPVFAQYASDGYAVFLPDIRFEVGTPGFAATKSLVPGVQELVDRGIADPDGLGLHGHSWSGYQTAFIVTKTDIFDAAVAGAPVSNMTSAYSGIRWESGLARQFQYEQYQSRIGGSLWEYPELYIENSPVFYADRIETPLLIQFGDEDGAVPWYQGIELYLAMRRLQKDAIFLQYRGEPHHLKEYPNKLDYAIKMKQYFDHYLKGEEAPDWITKGVPYRGE